jgi:hypothetical protein
VAATVGKCVDLTVLVEDLERMDIITAY